MIAIKDTPVLMQLMTMEYHPRLVMIVAYITDMWDRTVITSAYRGGDKGVHGTDPCRAVDIRSWIFSNPEKVVGRINQDWEYDPERPEMIVALYHDAGSGNHIHLQAHNNTRRRRTGL